MPITSPRFRAALTWMAGSTVLGWLVAALLTGDGQDGSIGASLIGVIAHYGLFVFAVVAVSTVAGAILGDLPGLRRAPSVAFVAWVTAQRRHRTFRLSWESMVLVSAWVALCLSVKAAWSVPAGVWYLFTLFGLVRCIQLGTYLTWRRLYRQAE